MATSFSAATGPCTNCRAKHQKCDKKKPSCSRCTDKRLSCVRAPRRSPFRPGSTANFETQLPDDQPWVNSCPKAWPAASQTSEQSEDATPIPVSDTPIRSSPDTTHQDPVESAYMGLPTWTPVRTQASLDGDSFHVDRTWAKRRKVHASNSPKSSGAVAAGTSVQEACLLRYFIEELSPWFDHCDDLRHFQRVVPRRAQHSAVLRNAILAVSARHLVRLPHYQTSGGILYHGQHLTRLTTSTAVEYMLNCVPDLIRFPEIEDPEGQENIMAATVILRQYEEMEDDTDGDTQAVQGPTNFLAVTQTIINCMITSRLDQSLATAAYWIVIRQEVYFALTRERAPHMRFDLEDWMNASMANTMIMFASEVTKWCWGEKSTQEWDRLRGQQHRLSRSYAGDMIPMIERPAQRSQGEIFPTVWYRTDDQVTAVQHLELAKMILIAGNPHLDRSHRAACRKAESQVRSIVLNICGIAMNHLRTQPALVNAVIAITLYGDYFTEMHDRHALLQVVDCTRDLRSWPMHKVYQRLDDRWRLTDSDQV